MDDCAIIDLFFARKEQAIWETDLKYGKLCLVLAHNILSNSEDAEECVNDTYLTVWNKIPPTRPSHFKAFICKLVRNLSMKKLDYNFAEKRDSNLTVSFSELENIYSSTQSYTEQEYESLGKLISIFLSKEKEVARNVFIRKYFSLTPSAILRNDMVLPKARLKTFYIIHAINCENF